MATKTEAPSGDTTITLTVIGGRIVNGHHPGATFEFDLGVEGTDERAVNERQVRAWVAGGHVADPVLATRKRKRRKRKPRTSGGDS